MKGKLRKEQILQAAVEVFAEHGYEKTSIAMICEKVKIGRGTLYQYFRDKNSLFRELTEYHAGRIVSLMGAYEYEETISSLEEFLVLRLIKILVEISDNREAYKILLHEAPAKSTGMDKLVQEIRRRMIAVTTEDLRMGTKLGFFQVDDPELFATLFIGATLLAAEYCIFDTEVPAEPEGLARKIARFQLRCLTGSSG